MREISKCCKTLKSWRVNLKNATLGGQRVFYGEAAISGQRSRDRDTNSGFTAKHTHTPSSTQGKQILILTTIMTLALVDLSSTRDISP